MPRPAAAWLLGSCGAPMPSFPGEATRGPVRPSSVREGQPKAQSPPSNPPLGDETMEEEWWEAIDITIVT